MYAMVSLAVACGGTSESSSPDASGVDATLPDAGTDTLVAADTSPLPDSAVLDASMDVADEATDAACAINVTAVAKCENEAGFACLEYVGSGWTPANFAAGCSVDSGYVAVWDAACPTTGRIGSCASGQGACEFVERCYPPFNSNQCQGLCLFSDGGYCPN